MVLDAAIGAMAMLEERCQGSTKSLQALRQDDIRSVLIQASSLRDSEDT